MKEFSQQVKDKLFNPCPTKSPQSEVNIVIYSDYGQQRITLISHRKELFN